MVDLSLLFHLLAYSIICFHQYDSCKFIHWVVIQPCFIYFLAKIAAALAIGSSFSWFPCASDTLLLGTSLLSSTARCSWCLSGVPHPVREWVISPRIAGSFCWKIVSKTKIWAPGTLLAARPSELTYDEMHVCILTPVYASTLFLHGWVCSHTGWYMSFHLDPPTHGSCATSPSNREVWLPPPAVPHTCSRSQPLTQTPTLLAFKLFTLTPHGKTRSHLSCLWKPCLAWAGPVNFVPLRAAGIVQPRSASQAVHRATPSAPWMCAVSDQRLFLSGLYSFSQNRWLPSSPH